MPEFAGSVQLASRGCSARVTSDPDQKKYRSISLKYLESVSYGFVIGFGLAKILKTNNLVAKYSIQRT
jgi:hypothetical protein